MSSLIQRSCLDRLSQILEESNQLNKQLEEYYQLRRDAERWRMLQRIARNYNKDMGWVITIDAQQGPYLHYNLASAVDAMLQAQLERDGTLPDFE